MSRPGDGAPPIDPPEEPRVDFLTSLAQRALGVAVLVQPRLRPRFAPSRPAPSLFEEDLEVPAAGRGTEDDA